jgi:hypothetical protein
LLLLLLLLRHVRMTFAQYQESRNKPAAVVVAAAAAASHPLAKIRLTRSKLRTAELTCRSSWIYCVIRINVIAIPTIDLTRRRQCLAMWPQRPQTPHYTRWLTTKLKYSGESYAYEAAETTTTAATATASATTATARL